MQWTLQGFMDETAHVGEPSPGRPLTMPSQFMARADWLPASTPPGAHDVRAPRQPMPSARVDVRQAARLRGLGGLRGLGEWWDDWSPEWAPTDWSAGGVDVYVNLDLSLNPPAITVPTDAIVWDEVDGWQQDPSTGLWLLEGDTPDGHQVFLLEEFAVTEGSQVLDLVTTGGTVYAVYDDGTMVEHPLSVGGGGTPGVDADTGAEAIEISPDGSVVVTNSDGSKTTVPAVIKPPGSSTPLSTWKIVGELLKAAGPVSKVISDLYKVANGTSVPPPNTVLRPPTSTYSTGGGGGFNLGNMGTIALLVGGAALVMSMSGSKK